MGDIWLTSNDHSSSVLVSCSSDAHSRGEDMNKEIDGIIKMYFNFLLVCRAIACSKLAIAKM